MTDYTVHEIEKQIFEFEGVVVELSLLARTRFSKRWDEVFDHPIRDYHHVSEIYARIQKFYEAAAIIMRDNVVNMDAVRRLRQNRGAVLHA